MTPCPKLPAYMTAAAFSALLGVHRSTVGRWIREGLPVRRLSGRSDAIDVTQATRWLMARKAGQQSAQERLAAARADQVEAENDRRRHELIRADVVRDAGIRMEADLARRLEALPDRVAERIAGMNAAQIRSLLLSETRQVRSGFARFMVDLANSPPAVAA